MPAPQSIVGSIVCFQRLADLGEPALERPASIDPTCVKPRAGLGWGPKEGTDSAVGKATAGRGGISQLFSTGAPRGASQSGHDEERQLRKDGGAIQAGTGCSIRIGFDCAAV
jgi:hypothetical protein